VFAVRGGQSGSCTLYPARYISVRHLGDFFHHNCCSQEMLPSGGEPIPGGLTVLPRINLMFLFTLIAICVLQGCGTTRPPAISNSSLASSEIGCNNGACSGSVEVPLILVNGTDPATFGLPISCSVTAGSQAMSFIAVPSMPWFGVSPGSGKLDAGGTTALSVNSMNGSAVSGRNIGIITLSASGYKDNNQMAVELNCNILAGTCKVAFSCEPSKYSLP